MTPEQIRLVQESFARIVPIRDRVTGLIYERLFELDPGLRAMFRGDMARQRSRFALALAMMVHGLKNQGAIIPVLQELGRRHAGYGVRPGHYATLREALFWALERTFGDDFTPELREAWTRAYDLATSTMLEAAAQPAGAIKREAA